MGTRIIFRSGARALVVAIALGREGHGVLWDPRVPRVVMTSADEQTCRDVSSRYAGHEEDWSDHERIDLDRRAR